MPYFCLRCGSITWKESYRCIGTYTIDEQGEDKEIYHEYDGWSETYQYCSECLEDDMLVYYFCGKEEYLQLLKADNIREVFIRFVRQGKIKLKIELEEFEEKVRMLIVDGLTS